VPKKSNLRCVKLNAKQCKVYRVVINDAFEAKFEYYDVTLEVTPQDAEYNQQAISHYCLDHRNAVLETDPDVGGGN
jgi:transcription initiation factor TFIID subunit 2